jgi:hypothetical protein
VKTHRSAVAWWIAVAIALPPITSTIVVVSGVMSADGSAALAGAVALAGYALLVVGLILPMRDIVGDDGLVIRFGMVRVRIPWDRVIEINPTRNPLSGPALSLDRLDVRYRKANGRQTFALISPADRAAFLRDCAEASRRHVVAGDALRTK